jgi:ElaB/YqjD/DUF883 family membrane-anchored ribosome-binding protein
MSVAAILKYSANAFVGAVLVKLVAGDMASRTHSVVRRSPYRIAGAVTAMGVVAGMLLAQHRHHRA